MAVSPHCLQTLSCLPHRQPPRLNNLRGAGEPLAVAQERRLRRLLWEGTFGLDTPQCSRAAPPKKQDQLEILRRELPSPEAGGQVWKL